MLFAKVLALPTAAALLTASSPPASAVQGPAQAVQARVSRRRASLRFDFSDDSRLSIMLAGGRILLNGTEAGRYQPGGPLERAWRGLLAQADTFSTAGVIRGVKLWKVDGLAGPDLSAKQAIAAALTNLKAAPTPPAPVAAAGAPPPQEPVSPGDSFREGLGEKIKKDIRRSVEDARRRAEDVSPDLTPRPRAAFAGVGPAVAGLLGAFVALGCIAFGLVSFAPRQLEIVSGTVQQSFVRSFFAGLFAQPLILPALAMLIVGLILTVVGILVIPVAVIGFVLAVAAGVVGGYIAAARALGDLYLRRKMAQGDVVTADPTYRSIVVGLGALLAIWTPFALLGWVPVAGPILLWTAIIFTWVMATAGFGATILSRAGLRSSFGRHGAAELSGELSWSTVDEIAPSRPSSGRSVP